MRLFEYEGNSLFRKESIPVPDFELADTPEAAVEAAQKLGLPAMVKAQVLTGGAGWPAACNLPGPLTKSKKRQDTYSDRQSVISR